MWSHKVGQNKERKNWAGKANAGKSVKMVRTCNVKRRRICCKTSDAGCAAGKEAGRNAEAEEDGNIKHDLTDNGLSRVQALDSAAGRRLIQHIDSM